MNASLKKFARRVGAPTLLMALLLTASCAALAFSLSESVRGLDTELMYMMAFVGMGCGWALARTRVRARYAGFILVGSAFAIAFVRVGHLGALIVNLMAAFGNVLWRAQMGQWEPAPFWMAVEPLRAAIATMFARVMNWGAALWNTQSLYEPVALALVWSSAVFLVAAWAAWHIRRAQRAFDALIPLVVLLGAVIAYSERNVWVMFIVLGMWFGLLVVTPYFARKKRWEENALPYAEDLWMDTTFLTVPVILVLVTLAMGAPVVSPESIARWVREWNERAPASAQIISTSFGIEPAPPAPPSALDFVSSPGLPRSHLLGAGPELLFRTALTIQSDDLNETFPARYWLGATYDEYTGRGWFSSGFNSQTFAPEERVWNVAPPARVLVRQNVRVENNSGLLYAAGMLDRADKPFQIAWRQPEDMFGAQINTNAYQAASYVSIADARALRAAGEAYPPWIGSQYLRLPSDTPPRVLALARNLTATVATPFDRARALENYLRAIPYSLDVPMPPPGRDVTDYFLFDLRRGYCDYYATAMAVLARAAGLPARIAVGYAAGDYDADTHTYHVLEANAHSWTQIYFPAYGWINFEPTSGRAALDFDAPPVALPAAPNNVTAAPDGLQKIQEIAVTYCLWLPGIVVVVALMLALLAFADSVYLARIEENAVARILYRRMLWYARQCGVPMVDGLTPQQISEQLQTHFQARQDSQTLARLWNSFAPVLAQIVARYESVTYGANDLNAAQRAQLVREWQAECPALVLALLLDMFLTWRARTIPAYNVS